MKFLITTILTVTSSKWIVASLIARHSIRTDNHNLQMTPRNPKKESSKRLSGNEYNLPKSARRYLWYTMPVAVKSGRWDPSSNPALIKSGRWDPNSDENSGDEPNILEDGPPTAGLNVQNEVINRGRHTKPSTQYREAIDRFVSVSKFGKSNHQTGEEESQPTKRFTAGLPAICKKPKTVSRCRTAKYEGRGVTYCWYEITQVCTSVD